MVNDKEAGARRELTSEAVTRGNVALSESLSTMCADLTRRLPHHYSNITRLKSIDHHRTFPSLRALLLPIRKNHDSLLMLCNLITVRCDSLWSSSPCLPKHLAPKAVQPPIKYVTSAEINTRLGKENSCQINNTFKKITSSAPSSASSLLRLS